VGIQAAFFMAMKSPSNFCGPMGFTIKNMGIFGWSKKGAADGLIVLLKPGVLQGSTVGKYVSGWWFGTLLL